MIHDNLMAIVARTPETSGLRYEGRFQSYARLAERIGRLASGFSARGIGIGDPVAILLPNSPDLFIVAHALFGIGAIAMPLSLAATRAEHLGAARKARIAAVVAHPALVGMGRKIVEETGGAKPLPLFVSGSDDDSSLMALERTAQEKLPRLNGDAPALYLLSSGSTGLPKVVPHTHAELLADGHRTSRAWQLTPDDIVFDMLPGNFAMGFLLGAMDALEAGATTVYWNDPRPLVLARRALLETLEAERVTVIGAVPAMYEAIVSATGDFDLGTNRLTFSGGAALKRGTYEQFRERFGIRIRQDYGSTEATMVSHNDAHDIDRIWDSVGKPAGGAQARIAPMDDGFGAEVGELMIRSSSMMCGYLDEGQINAAAFSDGWLMSGDLARLDDEGNIFIMGRSKLLIEVSGFKIDPIEVEDILQQHPAVAEAAVVGVHDTRCGELRLKAFIVRSDDVSPEVLIRYLRQHLSAQKVPTLIEFRDELPRSSAGKMMRSLLSKEA
ncbi:MAG: class I adenylate-forming enzyme family protein [Devosia sp.]